MRKQRLVPGPGGLELIRHDRNLGRRTWLLPLDSLDNCPDAISLRSPRFALLVACDFSEYSDDAIKEFATRMHVAGLSAVCTWGPDCERAHDLFDGVDTSRIEVSADRDLDAIVMSTWHDNDDLEDALSYFWLNICFCRNLLEQQTRAWFTITVGDNAWAYRARRWLRDPYRYEPQNGWVSRELLQKYRTAVERLETRERESTRQTTGNEPRP